MTRRVVIVAGLAALAAAACPAHAVAQFYKGKTVTMIINYPAGGPTDIEGRIIARHRASHIAGKPTIIVKNIGGAGGMIGSNFFSARSPSLMAKPSVLYLEPAGSAAWRSGTAGELFRLHAACRRGTRWWSMSARTRRLASRSPPTS